MANKSEKPKLDKKTDQIEPTDEDLELMAQTHGLSNRLHVLDDKYPVLDPND